MKIVITGSEGLIGSALSASLINTGHTVHGFDTVLCPECNILHQHMLDEAMEHCEGVIHLAAVSRVIWGERDPDLCWRTNAEGTKNVLEAAARSSRKPWVLVASSREVYGQPESLPANEDAPLAPINIYGRSKVQGERYTFTARECGLQTAVARLSNVYGSTEDHFDRVVPAFARAAACGEDLRLEGGDNTFDFTYIDDVVDGLMRIVRSLTDGESKLPPMHFVSGHATSLKQLADLSMSAVQGVSKAVEAPARHYDVGRFCGDPTRARKILGWEASTAIGEGVRRMVASFSVQFGDTGLKTGDGHERRIACVSSK